MGEKMLPQSIRQLMPEAEAYMQMIQLEKRMDQIILRKRLAMQEAIKKPIKTKRKLRIMLSNTYTPGSGEVKPAGEAAASGATTVSPASAPPSGSTHPENAAAGVDIPSWELRVEGRLLDESGQQFVTDPKLKRKFSSFFKSLVIELDKDLYGPDNHLVEWHRTHTTQETDGFQVKRPGCHNVKCTVLLMLDYQPPQFKLDARLARLLGIHTNTKAQILLALWNYVKTHHLQDAHERDFINCDAYMQQIFEVPRMRFSEIPGRLQPLLQPPDPIVINHVITVDQSQAAAAAAAAAASGGTAPEGNGAGVNGASGTTDGSSSGPMEQQKKTTCYDIDVEIDDPYKATVQNFVNLQGGAELQSIENKIFDIVEQINQLRMSREFYQLFADDPQQFITTWLASQCRDLKVMTDQAGNPEEERRADFYTGSWTQEAVMRYFYNRINQRRQELEHALGLNQ